MDSLLSPLTCPVFIGRAAERAALRDLLERARDGSGQVALVSGEAGIGKTRLVAEVAADAARLGFLLLEGRCYEAESGLPYAPLLDLLRTLLERRPADDFAHASMRATPLARLLPEWAPDRPVPEDAPPDKRQVFAGITRAITDLTAQSPVLLVMEDLHWGDDLSLECLLHLARRCRHLPLLLLVTARADEAAPEARRWLAELHRERLAHELALAPLGRAELCEMAAALLPAGDTVGVAVLDAIYTRSEGNPFFAEELLRALATTGGLARVRDVWQLTSAQPPLPPSVHELVRQRTERLSPPARRALAVAAVAGRGVEYRLLRAVLGLEDEPLVALLKEVIAARLLVEEHTDQYVFRHALIREAVYGEPLGRERAALHRAIGEAIETLNPEGPARQAHLPDLAAHFSAGGDWARALAYAERAAAQALALHAPRAAIEHAARAEEAAEQLNLPPRHELTYLRGQAHEALGAFEPARASYERALTLAEMAEAHEDASRCLLALGFLWAGREYGQAGQWFDRALRLAERIGDDALLARSLNRYGNWLANTGRISESLAAHERALRLCDALGDAPGRATSLDLLGIAYGMAGDRVAATAHLSQAIALFTDQGDQRSLCTSLAMRAIHSHPGSSETTESPQRPMEMCIQDATEALRLARLTASLTDQIFAENALAHTLLAFGELGRALAHMRAAREGAGEIEHQQWMVATTYGLGLIYAELGALDDAIATLEYCQEQASALGSAFWRGTVAAHLGLAYARKGLLPAAAATLRRALPAEQPPRTVAERSVALASGWVFLAQGEPARALAIADQLLATVPREASGAALQPIPHVLLLRGEALQALGCAAEAATALESARLGAAQRQARPLLWTIHRALAGLYRAQRRHEAARRERTAARALVADLAATLDDGPQREGFQRAALASLPPERPLRPNQHAKQAFGGLTAREREVAALIARGATSREIARALTISERTAETHVGHVLGKLGFSSRAQIAAWAVAAGLAQA